MRPLLAACLAALVVASAVPSGALAAGGSDRSAAHPGAGAAPPDPAADVIGWEDGYWHNESIDVDQSDGLTEAELDAYVARAMARVEFLRDREFDQSVPVSTISRDAYRDRTGNGSGEQSAFGAWNNQVWEALFVVGEDSDVQQSLGDAYGASVAGFYAPRDGEIKIVTESPDSPVIDNATLIHELVHALQDQQYDLTAERYHGQTQDADLAVDGLVEGEANYIESRYADRCGTEWECVATPPDRGGGDGDTPSPPNLGILLTLLNPYSDGPHYVSNLLDRGGWAAVDDAHADPPTSTEQVIHLTDEAPTPIRFTDRARGGWEPFPNQGENGSDTAGEASMFVMFWYQARESGADTVDPQVLGRTDGEYDLYNYAARPSAGWGNDRIVPYRKDGADGGYVWVTEWDTAADAREFHAAYAAVLRARDADRRADGTWVIDDGPFADAFVVARNGTRVTVVNGPTPEATEAIRPGAREETTAEPPTVTATSESSGVSAPGFGPAAAVTALALAGVAALARRRRRIGGG